MIYLIIIVSMNFIISVQLIFFFFTVFNVSCYNRISCLHSLQAISKKKRKINISDERPRELKINGKGLQAGSQYNITGCCSLKGECIQINIK